MSCLSPIPKFRPAIFPVGSFIYLFAHECRPRVILLLSLCSARPALQIFIVIYSLLGADFLLQPRPAGRVTHPHEIASNRYFNIINLPFQRYVPLIN